METTKIEVSPTLATALKAEGFTVRCEVEIETSQLGNFLERAMNGVAAPAKKKKTRTNISTDETLYKVVLDANAKNPHGVGTMAYNGFEAVREMIPLFTGNVPRKAIGKILMQKCDITHQQMLGLLNTLRDDGAISIIEL